MADLMRLFSYNIAKDTRYLLHFAPAFGCALSARTPVFSAVCDPSKVIVTYPWLYLPPPPSTALCQSP